MTVAKLQGFRHKGLNDGELIQAGRVGVVEALAKHDPRKGMFSTIAVLYIAGALRKQFGLVRKTAAEKPRVVRKPKAVPVAEMAADTFLSEAEIAEAALDFVKAVEKEAVAVAEMNGLAEEVATINSEEESGCEMTSRDALAEGGCASTGHAMEPNDPDFREPEFGQGRKRPQMRQAAVLEICREMQTEGDIAVSRGSSAFGDIIAPKLTTSIAGTLTEQEAATIRMHFLEGMTQAEVGKALSLSASTVQRVIKVALQKLSKQKDLVDLKDSLKD